jgi:predicted Zn-dependent protease with MMP-like domain
VEGVFRKLKIDSHNIHMIISQIKFETMVRRELAALIQRLPADLAEAAGKIAILTAHRPSKYQIDGVGDDDLLGLYEGVPFSDRRIDDGNLPDRITLFRIPLMDSCGNESELRQEIQITLIHEFGHALGFDEDDLAERGLD